MKQTKLLMVLGGLLLALCVGLPAHAETNMVKNVKAMAAKAKGAKDPKDRMAAEEPFRQIKPTTKGDIEGLLDAVDAAGSDEEAAYISIPLQNVHDRSFGSLFYNRYKTAKGKSRDISLGKLMEFKYKDSVQDMIDVLSKLDRPVKKLGSMREIAMYDSAARTLGEMRDERAIPVLLSKLGMTDTVYNALGKFGKKALPDLVKVEHAGTIKKAHMILGSDPDRLSDADMRAKDARHAISYIRDKEAILDLWELAKTDTDNLIVYVEALENMTDDTTTPTRKELMELVKKHSGDNRELGLTLLQDAKKRGDVDYLINVVKDKHSKIEDAEMAIYFLGQMKAQAAIPVLLELSTNSERSIGGGAAEALTEITGQKYEWRPKK